jgi:hypothetical protein
MGRFFIICACTLILLILVGLGPSGVYRVEVLQRKAGYSSVAATEDFVAGFNLRNQRVDIFDPIHGNWSSKLEMHPISGQYFPDRRELMILPYLAPCIFAVTIPSRAWRKICMSSDRFYPGAIAAQGSRQFLAGSVNQPEGGFREKQVYYMPELGRFAFFIRAGRKVFEKRWIRVLPGNTSMFYEVWHEESASPWRIVPLEDASILVLNPNAEMLYRYNYRTKKMLWKIDVGRKPTGLVADERTAYVASAQQGAIQEIGLEDGELAGSIEVGRGIREIVMIEGKIFAVNPYERALLRIEPDSQTVKKRILNDALPMGIASAGRSIWVGDGHSRKVISFNQDLETLSTRKF